MNKKNILIIVAYYLPGYKSGGPVRSISSIVNALGDKFNFKIITRDRDFGDIEPYPGVVIDTWNKHDNCEVFYCSPRFLKKRLIKELIENTSYDMVHINSFFDFSLSIVPIIYLKYFSKRKETIILAPRGEFSPGALDIKYSKKKLFIFLAKRFGLYNRIQWHATDEMEKCHIQKLFSYKAKVTKAFNIAFRPNEIIKIKNKKRNHIDLVFLSRISPKKNLLFALQLLAKISGSITFHIYGPVEDFKYLSQCKNLINKLPNTSKVEFKGTIDHDKVYSTLAEYDLLLFPTLGENFGHIIYESLAASTPVMISDLTPWNYLEKNQAGWVTDLVSENSWITKLQNIVNMEEQEYYKFCNNAKNEAEKYSKNAINLQQNLKLFDLRNVKKITIGIDATNIKTGGGVTHLYELIRNYTHPNNNIDKIIVFGGSALLNLKGFKDVVVIYSKILDMNFFFQSFWKVCILPFFAKQNCDCIFSPGGSFAFSIIPYVSMSQNMLIFETKERNRYPFFSATRLRLTILYFIQRKSFLNSNGMIYISKYAKDYIENKIPALKSKNHKIIYHGVSERFFRPPIQQYSISTYTLRKPYKILYLSTIDVYKHQANVILALKKLFQEGYPLELHLTGSISKYCNKSFNSLLNRNLDFVKFDGLQPYDKIETKYHEADLFIFASTCENMPNILVEAMASGLPILSSDYGPMKEILGDSAEYFNPLEIGSIRTAMEKLLLDEKRRTELSQKAYKRSQEFSWERCAKETFNFIMNCS